jgi:chemotaxis response regulator CheB/chemotaxis methyl-accepting protein methylase
MAIESFLPAERELVFKMAREITGTAFSERSRHEVIITNVIKRVNMTGCSNLTRYLDFITQHPTELDHLISAMTIHTTSWFREMPHFRLLEDRLRELGSHLIGQKFRFLSAACSSGEELYSLGCILESYRRHFVGFEYELYGFDLDPISLEKAKSGVYEIERFDTIPRAYQPYFLYKKKTIHKTFSIDPQIRKRSFFSTINLQNLENAELPQFDQIFCRNVLIYFRPEEVERTAEKLFKFLKPNGFLSFGHCESISTKKFSVTCIGNSTYTRLDISKFKTENSQSLNVLVVDDSPSILKWVRGVLVAHEIGCDTAESAAAATQYLKSHVVDLVILDFNMPDKSGLEWLTEQRQNAFQTPVVLFTDVQTQDAPQILEALEGLAQDYMNKSWVGSAPEEFVARIKSIVASGRNKFKKLDQQASLMQSPIERAPFEDADLILVGASTGGTEAMSTLLAQMPAGCPPVICVQHIPKEFAEAFFKRLCALSGLKPGNTRNGQELLPGHLYMPLVEAHIGIHQVGEKLTCYLSNAEKIFSQKPSVDFLFQSASFLTKKKIVAALLTGMGKDGAAGMLELKKIGAYTLAQDENSSLVWGMPGEAHKIGAVKYLGDLHHLRMAMFATLQKKARLSRIA